MEIAPLPIAIFKSKLARKRFKGINEVALSQDPRTPLVDIEIDGIIISKVQIDGGSNINLINKDAMLSLQLLGLQSMKFVLRMGV